MTRQKGKLTALLLAAVLAASAVLPALAAPAETGPALPAESKISEELMAEVEQAEDGTATAMVWFSDIDLSSTETAGQAAMAAVTAAQGAIAAAAATGQTGETEDMAAIQAYITAKRAEAAELYTAYNTRLAAELFREEDIIYISRYSPVVLVEVDQEGVTALARSADVSTVSYYDDAADDVADDADVAAVSDTVTTISLANVNTITRATTVQTSAAYGYTGAGVKIGIFDTGLPIKADFSGLNIYYDPSCTGTATHASVVLDVLSSIAPDATYYCTGLSSVTESLCMTRIEWLLSQGVNVINASRVIGTDGNDTYGTMAKWLDHIAYQHDVHFVQAAGNSGANSVVSGAMAYNIITVGNLNPNGTTSLSDDVIRSTSSYYLGSRLAYKPDLCAPGTGVKTAHGTESGTSLSAPQVAGAIALLCQQRPGLLTAQSTVKAILTASVNFSSDHRYTPAQTNYRKYGAGLLDCVGACYVAGNYRYVAGSLASGASKTHTFTVTSSDTRIRVSLAFNMRSVESGSGHTATPTVGSWLNLNITVKNPNGTTVASSNTVSSNVEIVDFVPTMTGTYTVEITRADSASEAAYYGLAWR